MNILEGDLYVKGTFRADRMVLATNSVGDGQVDANNPLGVTKVIHRLTPSIQQGKGASIVSKTGELLHVAVGAGDVVGFRISVSVAGVTWAGGGKVSVDLKKNGTTILSSPAEIDGTNAAYDVEIGTISTAAYVADDVFDAVITVTAGTGTLPQGLTVQMVVNEASS